MEDIIDAVLLNIAEYHLAVIVHTADRDLAVPEDGKGLPDT